MNIVYIVLFFLALTFPAFGQTRSLAQLFPGLDEESRNQVFSPEGSIITTELSEKTAQIALRFTPSPETGVSVAGPILQMQPAFLVESLMVIPHGNSQAGLAQVYNALGKVRNLKGREYNSFTRKKRVPLFEDAVRLESEKKLIPVSDPPPVSSVPHTDTIYMCLKDVNFGNSYYRADITRQGHGLLCGLTNFKNLSYLLFPVIKKDKFCARLYFEPIAEGILIYGVAGADISDFVASQVDMPSAIEKRIMVIIGWVADGIREG